MSHEYTRRAIAHVSEGIATIYCPTTLNACRFTFQRQSSKPDGYYRCKAWFSGGSKSADIGSPIKPEREAARLDKLAEKRVHARTLSPGICGFQDRERASQAAGEARKYESRQLAELLRELIKQGAV